MSNLEPQQTSNNQRLLHEFPIFDEVFSLSDVAARINEGTFLDGWQAAETVSTGNPVGRISQAILRLDGISVGSMELIRGCGQYFSVLVKLDLSCGEDIALGAGAVVLNSLFENNDAELPLSTH